MIIEKEYDDETEIIFHVTFYSKPNRDDYERFEDRIRNTLKHKGVWTWGGFFNRTKIDSIRAIKQEIEQE